MMQMKFFSQIKIKSETNLHNAICRKRISGVFMPRLYSIHHCGDSINF